MSGPTETDAPASPALAVQPTASYFAVAGCALALALALLDPDSSTGLGFAPRLGYWLTHVGGALVLLVALQRLMIPATPQLSLGAVGRVAIVGLLGAVVFLPVARILEGLFFDQPPSRLIEEATEVVPQVFVFWALLNLPFLLRLGRPDAATATSVDESPAPSSGPSSMGAPAPSDDDTDGLLTLPPQLGDRLVAISTELHYLRVYTALGNALVLGSLSKLEASGELPEGQRIHRSHWVATQAVQRLAKRDGALACVLENGLELPVSRRQAKAAREAFGGVEMGTLERPERPRPR